MRLAGSWRRGQQTGAAGCPSHPPAELPEASPDDGRCAGRETACRVVLAVLLGRAR